MELVEMELIDKEKVLEEKIKDIAQLDEAIILIDDQKSALTAEKLIIEEYLIKGSKIEKNCISTTNKADVKYDSFAFKRKTYQKFNHANEVSGSEPMNGKLIMRTRL